MLPDLTPAEIARLWAKLGPPDENGCRDWIGRPGYGGYGQAHFRGNSYAAHRVMFLLGGGILSPEQPHVCHRCNRPICCAPEHLYADNAAGNSRYMVESGRHYSVTRPEALARGDRNGSRRFPESVPRGALHGLALHPERRARGARHGAAKLSEADVHAIRAFDPALTNAAAVGRLYGISGAQARKIMHRQSWKHL